MAVDPRRNGYVNNSAATQASRGYFARERLKSLFPPRSRTWIGKARRWNRRSKEDLLAQVLGGPWKLVRKGNGRPDQARMIHRRSGEERPVPAWYSSQTKGEAWMDQLVPPVVMRAAEDVFEDAADLWRVAVGDVHPADLSELLLSPRECRSRKERYREDRLSWRRIDQETAGQQALDL